MPSYNIKEWQAILLPNSTFPYPMLYIKPDEAFSQYAKENDYSVVVKIQNTNSKYDLQSFIALVDTGATFPNYRPNFYNQTGYYILTLVGANWLGYPPQNGTVFVQGNEGPDKLPVEAAAPFVAPKPIEWYGTLPEPEIPLQTDSNCNNLSSTQLGLVLLSVFLIFGALFVVSSKGSLARLNSYKV